MATPEYCDSDIALYCSAKSGKVRKLGLPYISDDFQILLQTESDYKSEVKSLRQDVYQLSLDFSHVDGNEVGDWISQNLVFLEKLDLKLPKVAKQEKISESKSFLIQKYLGFQNLLDYLKIERSEIYVKINELINNRSSFLESRFLTDSSK